MKIASDAVQEDLMTVETEPVGVEGRAGCEQGPDGVSRLLPERQHDGDPAAAFRTDLERGEPLCDLGEHAGLRDARDRERVSGARSEHEARAAVDALLGGAANANLGEILVGDLTRRRLRARHPVETHRAREQFELSPRERMLSLSPDHSIARPHDRSIAQARGVWHPARRVAALR